MSNANRSRGPTSGGRRSFLKHAASAGGAAAVAVVASRVVAATEDGAEVESKQPVSKGYQLTQHIRDYYQTAKV